MLAVYPAALLVDRTTPLSVSLHPLRSHACFEFPKLAPIKPSGPFDPRLRQKTRILVRRA